MSSHTLQFVYFRFEIEFYARNRAHVKLFWFEQSRSQDRISSIRRVSASVSTDSPGVLRPVWTTL